MKLKKLLMVGVCVCLGVSALTFGACEAESKNLKYALNADGESYKVVGMEYEFTEVYDVVIPATYEGKPVTSIGVFAFGGSQARVRSVKIPDSVTTIEASAFSSVSDNALERVELGNGVQTIGEEAFQGNWGLHSISIPASVTSIASNAFVYDELNSITVDAANTTYDSRNNCNAIIETATNKLVLGCDSTVIPDDVTAIGDYAFRSTSAAFTGVTIPASVTEIGVSAFHGTDLTSVTFSEGLLSIGEKAFYECEGLTQVEIPNSVTAIGDMAFQGCPDLTKVIIGSGVTYIDGIAFANGVNAYRIFFRGTEAQWSTIKSGTKWAMEVICNYTGD